MVSIYDLLKEEKKKVEEVNKMKISVVELKRLRDLDEADIWLSTDFKALGATNDKLRSAVVTKTMSQFPNTYEQKKAKISVIENEIKYIREVIGVMKEFGVDEIDLEEAKEEAKDNKTEESSDSVSQ